MARFKVISGVFEGLIFEGTEIGSRVWNDETIGQSYPSENCEPYRDLRAIKVTYSNGTVISTSMAANLTDKQMLDYFKVGKWFNIGTCDDNMQTVIKAEIVK